MINIVRKNYKKIIFIAIVTYVCYTFLMQEKNINAYKKQQADYGIQLALEKEQQEELLILKNNANSPEYIEKMAREKLDMYLPNERVYIDIGR